MSEKESGWMEEARQIAAQCWCDDETKHIVMDPALAEAVARRIAVWMDTGAQHARNENYWHARVAELEADEQAALDVVEEREKDIARWRSLAESAEAEAAKWERAARRLAEFADDAEGQCKGPTGEPFTPDEWIVYAISTTAPGWDLAPNTQEEEG